MNRLIIFSAALNSATKSTRGTTTQESDIQCSDAAIPILHAPKKNWYDQEGSDALYASLDFAPPMSESPFTRVITHILGTTFKSLVPKRP